MEIEQYNTICFKTANVPNFSEMEIEQNNYHLTKCKENIHTRNNSKTRYILIKKRVLSEHGAGQQNKRCRAWGVKNYLINMYEGEDSNSQELHIQRLRDQATYSTLRQGEHIISLSMDKTFPDRRKMIVEEFCFVEFRRLTFSKGFYCIVTNFLVV